MPLSPLLMWRRSGVGGGATVSSSFQWHGWCHCAVLIVISTVVAVMMHQRHGGGGGDMVLLLSF